MVRFHEKNVNHITILLKYYEIFKTPFGLQRIKLVRGKITYPGIFYKTYCIVILLLISVATKMLFVRTFLQLIMLLPYPLFFSQILNFITVVTGFIAIYLNSLYVSNENYAKAFNLLLKVIHNLKFNCTERCRSFKRILFVFHGFLLFSICFLTILGIVIYKSYSPLIANFINYVTDLEMIHFVIETNLIARLVENVNSKLILFSKKKLSVENGVLMKMWKTNYATDKINTCILLELILNYNILFDIIDNMNKSYIFLVIIL